MEPQEIRNPQGERLDFSFHSGAPQSGGSDNRTVLVLGHGVTANKDRPFLVALAEGAAAAGMDVLRFSFAGNGESEGRFGDATVSKEVGDLGAVLDALEAAASGDGEQPSPLRMLYAGHSMGGAVGVLRAAEDPRIGGLVSLAGMVHVYRFAQRKFGELQPGRDCMWDKPECPLSQTYMDDMAQLGSLVELGAGIRVPWLLVHGVGDTVVPVEDARDIVAKNRTGAQLVELPNADHVFSGDGQQAMLDVVLPWLRQEF